MRFTNQKGSISRFCTLPNEIAIGGPLCSAAMAPISWKSDARPLMYGRFGAGKTQDMIIVRYPNRLIVSDRKKRDYEL